MTPSTDCAQLRISLGVYVLGAIEPAERAAVDAHLSVCGRCRDELASLAGLPAMLGRITEEQIEQLGPPPEELLDSVLAKVAVETRSHRRKNRIWLAVAAAALVVVTGVSASVLTSRQQTTPIAKPPPSSPSAQATTPPGPSEKPGRATTVSGVDPLTGVRARITMRPMDWGTAFTIRLSGAPADSRCRLVAVDKQGRGDIAGGWQVEYLGEETFAGSSMFHRKNLAWLDIRTVEGKRLLHIPV